MSDHLIGIRRLRAEDAELYRAIRLEGLEREPEAFASTAAMEGVQPIAWFASRLETRCVLGASEGAALLGVAGFYPLEGPKDRHKGVLFGMVVRPSARRRGIGAALVAQIIAHAAESVEQLQLAVGIANAPARRLYARLGFVEWGTEPRALKHGGVYSDEAWMVKFLTPK